MLHQVLNLIQMQMFQIRILQQCRENFQKEILLV